MGTTPGFDMPLEEAMETQRAIRRLKTDPVDDALVRRLIELALKAPTGSLFSRRIARWVRIACSRGIVSSARSPIESLPLAAD